MVSGWQAFWNAFKNPKTSIRNVIKWSLLTTSHWFMSTRKDEDAKYLIEERQLRNTALLLLSYPTF